MPEGHPECVDRIVAIETALAFSRLTFFGAGGEVGGRKAALQEFAAAIALLVASACGPGLLGCYCAGEGCASDA